MLLWTPWIQMKWNTNGIKSIPLDYKWNQLDTNGINFLESFWELITTLSDGLLLSPCSGAEHTNTKKYCTCNTFFSHFTSHLLIKEKYRLGIVVFEDKRHAEALTKTTTPISPIAAFLIRRAKRAQRRKGATPPFSWCALYLWHRWKSSSPPLPEPGVSSGRGGL